MSRAVRIVSSDESDTFDLRDPVNGYFVEAVTPPEENVRDTRVQSDFVDGSYRVTEVDDDGVLVVFARVEGATWGQVTARWMAARAAYRAESNFYVETEIDGVTTRYRAERPNVAPAQTTGEVIASAFQTYQLRFRVQPNPLVTIA